MCETITADGEAPDLVYRHGSAIVAFKLHKKDWIRFVFIFVVLGIVKPNMVAMLSTQHCITDCDTMGRHETNSGTEVARCALARSQQSK